jgi:hypothetical protein
MVKDEGDIIRDWIVYHGSMFGYSNLFVIDNLSTDGTYEILNEYKDAIHLFQLPHYKKKGIYMKELIDKYCPKDEIAFPIDADEFIVLYKNKVIVEKSIVLDYFKTIPIHHLYKANYIISLMNDQNGCSRATTEITKGAYSDYGSLAKSFFFPKMYKGDIDHGNHIPTENYFKSDICLIHFHERNIDQLKLKVINNISGFNYSLDKDFIEHVVKNNIQLNGVHHIHHYYKIMNRTFLFNTCNGDDFVDITPFSLRILNGCF